MKKIFSSLPFKLLFGVMAGLTVGLIASPQIMSVILTIKHIAGEIIFFSVPLIIIGFVASSITKLGSNATKLLGLAVILAYLSSVGAAIFSMFSGYILIPNLNVAENSTIARELPEILFELNIPQIMPVMSALLLSVMLGLATVWTNAKAIGRILDEFQSIMLRIVERIIIPILPVFIATTFAALSYEGMLTNTLPALVLIILIVIIGHFIWLALLYSIAAIYTRQNPFEVLRHYGSAYLTAVGTMSSAATLPVALKAAGKSSVLRKDMVDFGIPLFSNIHLCGSVLTEVFFVMVVSKMLYGILPPVETMLLFCVLLGIFAIGAPGVPGGTVVASLGLITGVLGFSDTGAALMLTIFALQDSFGTAANVTGDGALTMILSNYANNKSHRCEQ